MKYQVPEEEKSKLRLFKEVPKGERGGAAAIRNASKSWDEAKEGITELLTDGISRRQGEVIKLRALRTLFNSSEPVGPQRVNDLGVSPDRRRVKSAEEIKKHPYYKALIADYSEKLVS